MRNRAAQTAAVLTALGFGLAGAGPTPAAERGSRFELGLRANVVGGTGKPSNDIPGAGLLGRYRLGGRWAVAISLDHSPKFDVERAPELVGLASPEVIDAVGTSTALTGSLERTFQRPGGRWEWFWSAGIGINSVDIDDVSGPLVGGGSFDIATDAGTELQVLAGLGARRWLGDAWGFEAALRAEQRLADWQLVDRRSGAVGTIDDYFVRGVLLAVWRRF